MSSVKCGWWRNCRPAAAIALLLAVLVLAGCGGSGYAQSVQTESYNVRLSLDGTDFNAHTATIEVHDMSDQPVNDAQVVVAPLMAAHGMASPEQTAEALGNGRYRATAEFFSMIGDWEFDVRIMANGSEETARFIVPVQQ